MAEAAVELVYQAGGLLLVVRKSLALFKFLQQMMLQSLQICMTDKFAVICPQ